MAAILESSIRLVLRLTFPAPAAIPRPCPTALPPKPRIIGPKVRICIVASKYNEQFTDALVENAIEELGELVPQGRVDLIRVPGAFEIPVMVASVLDRDPPACIIALGLIIRGSTRARGSGRHDR